MTMTSLPIMYFALFDFEYEKGQENDVTNIDLYRDGSKANLMPEAAREEEADKKTFMTHPLLYRIGIERQCYTMKQYVAWIFYAMF